MEASFSEIAAGIPPISASVSSVSDANTEQNLTIQEIFSGLNAIEQASQENKKLSAQSAETAEDLKDNSKRILEMVRQLDNKKK